MEEKDMGVAARLLKELLDARYEAGAETNAIFCGTKEQTAEYIAAYPARVKAAKENLESVWRKAEAFMDARVNPYGTDIASVRDAFEVWAQADHRRLEPNECEADARSPSNNHYYEDDTTNHAYIGWCAAIAASKTEV